MRWLALVALAAGPLSASAQLDARIRAAGDGTVRFAYETKPGVEICDRGIRMGERHMSWSTRGGDDRARSCRSGMAEVELRVREGRVRAVDLVRNPAERSPDALDLGEVPAREAALHLLALPYGDATVDASEEAILLAMLADADEVWRPVLALARDRTLHRDVRERATFWLGQEAAEAATEGLSELALDDDEDQEIRDAAIFALSQRPPDEAVPALIEVARTGREAETRRRAMFWLAQTEDARAVDFFEEILLGRIR